MKKLTNLKGVNKLSKTAQKNISGGKSSCPIYSARRCRRCGGYPLPNGCCLGTPEVHACLTGIRP